MKTKEKIEFLNGLKTLLEKHNVEIYFESEIHDGGDDGLTAYTTVSISEGVYHSDSQESDTITPFEIDRAISNLRRIA